MESSASSAFSPEDVQSLSTILLYLCLPTQLPEKPQVKAPSESTSLLDPMPSDSTTESIPFQ